MPRLRLLLIVAIGVVVAAIAWQVFDPPAVADAPARPSGPPPIAVTTEPARQEALPVEIAANGTVVAEATITVRARVDGQIERVHVDEGQTVAPGQVLFTLDTDLLEAQLAQQEAQLARNRALARRAETDRARYASLQGEGFTAVQRFEQAVADAASAAATVRQDEALLAATRTEIEYGTIRAEAAGRLGAIPLRAGNLVRATDAPALATITPLDPIQVQFSVPERELPQILVSMAREPPPVRARAPADEGPPVVGRLVFIDSQVDTTTGTIALKARFANPEGRLWPGQYVRAVLVSRIEPDALTVPIAAVQQGQDGRYVFVLENGVAHRRPVELRRIAAGRAVLGGELRAGERVVVDGGALLADGARAIDRGAAQVVR